MPINISSYLSIYLSINLTNLPIKESELSKFESKGQKRMEDYFSVEDNLTVSTFLLSIYYICFLSLEYYIIYLFIMYSIYFVINLSISLFEYPYYYLSSYYIIYLSVLLFIHLFYYVSICFIIHLSIT